MNKLVDALRWQAQMGADEAISETPVDRRTASMATPAAEAVLFVPPPVADARRLAAEASTLGALRALLNAYEDSPLKKTATQLVFADGNPQAKLMLIGEAPGREEDEQGKPFVGRAGQLLDKMLAAIQLDRTHVYISNIVNWRPPGNRTPTPQEMMQFLPFIQRHIALVRPRLLVFLGNVATQALTGSKAGITKLRGRWLDYTDGDLVIPAMPTLHPAYLLRNPPAKKQAWEDLQAIRKRFDDV